MTPNPEVVRLLRSHPEFKPIRGALASYRKRGLHPVDVQVRERLKSIKAAAAGQQNEQLAKAAWCLETVADVQDHFVAAFQALKDGKFYDGWCELERSEILLHFLDTHYEDTNRMFGLEFIRAQTERFQSIFPYAVFMSPEFIHKKWRCSICNANPTPRRPCGHTVGEIYGGEMCVRIIEDVEIVAFALVRSPVQKYSVVSAADETDKRDYGVVRYVVAGLDSPWDGWHYQKTRVRHPHERYKDVKLTEPCPCESDLPYGGCCLPTPGVLRPHFQILFEKQPPSSLPHFQYSRP